MAAARMIFFMGFPSKISWIERSPQDESDVYAESLGLLAFPHTAGEGGWAGPNGLQCLTEQSARSKAGFGGWN